MGGEGKSYAGPASGKLSVWNMRAFKKAHTFAVGGDPVLDSLAFSTDGRLLLAAACDGFLRLFNTNAKSEVIHFVSALCFHREAALPPFLALELPSIFCILT